VDDVRLERLIHDERRARMVGWFDPPVLAQTALKMTTANIFGRHSDTRLVEALASQPQGLFDYSTRTGDFWIDYVADIGDGWNPTYAVASSVAIPQLTVVDRAGHTEVTQCGQILIFGGDQVYPYPSRDAYELRAEKPYATAFAGRGAKPDVFAIPGNHDWFDSLVAFSRTFCRPDRGFAGCPTQQTRSYFALKLPANWWLIAIDLQLGSELDEPQVKYLQRVAAMMQPEARVILCVPEPQWIFEASYPRERGYVEDPMRELEEKILRRPVNLFLTGDLHHYMRHENAAGVQKVVSGGGGAFLHPTHAPDCAALPNGFNRRAAYPDARTSSRLTWRNLLFPWLNPRCLIVPALLYGLSAWFASASLTERDLGTFAVGLHAGLTAAMRDPVNGLWLLTVVAAFVFFTDTHVKWYRIIGGVAHALTHLLAAFALAWLASRFTTQILGWPFGSASQLLIAGALTFVGGGVIGALIIGGYMLVSLQIFGRHSNEAFSSLRVQDYKQWLRLRVAPDGRLTLFAIGIDRVPRRWTKPEPDASPAVKANDPMATKPRLVDKVAV